MISGYPTDTYTSPNDYVHKLNGSGTKVGSSIVLKVMSGDKVNIRANSWYRLNGASPSSPANPLTDLITALATGEGKASSGKLVAADLVSSGALSPGMSDLLTNNTDYTGYNTSKPKAFLSWVLLDEQFRYVPSGSGVQQVGADDVFSTHGVTNQPIDHNGYLYIYVSNETPNVDVFFDNLQVTHTKGALLEETHYYPFGLTMVGISSKAAGKLENKKKYNGGSELNNQEFSDGSGLEMYDTHFRNLDPQLGRWWQIDPKPSDWESPYASMGNDPIRKNDPLGDIPTDPEKKGIWAGIKDGFIGFFKNIAHAANNPKDAFKHMVAQGYQNVAMSAASGGMIRPDVVQDVQTITTEGAYGVGKIIGREVAGAGVAFATEGAVKIVGNAAKVEIPTITGLPDNATVVRGGINTPTLIERGTGTHPSGVTGISVECGSCGVKELSKGLRNNQIGVTTVGEVRKAGGDVIKTSGGSPFHATMTGVPPTKASELLNPAIRNPNKLD